MPTWASGELTEDVRMLSRALEALRRDREREARVACRKLSAHMARREDGIFARKPRRSITIRLDDWSLRAAKLIAEIEGDYYQKIIRRWIEAAVLSEARRHLSRRPR